MIKTANQLKAKVRNLSGSNSQKAQTLIRNFVMERFLERITLSPYRNNFVLKGGMLVAAIVGLESRATMDIDTTVKSLNLEKEKAIEIVSEIIAVKIPDGINFEIVKVSDIMEEHDYPGIRFMLQATHENLRQTIKIDISTGDIITPGAVQFSYPLMFENRSISLWTYNLETLLAEKLETIMSRSTTNTRMRDFYDIHVLSQQKKYSTETLKAAFIATSTKRKTVDQLTDFKAILQMLKSDDNMQALWENYRKNTFFVGEFSWSDVITSVEKLAEEVTLPR